MKIFISALTNYTDTLTYVGKSGLDEPTREDKEYTRFGLMQRSCLAASLG